MAIKPTILDLLIFDFRCGVQWRIQDFGPGGILEIQAKAANTL